MYNGRYRLFATVDLFFGKKKKIILMCIILTSKVFNTIPVY